MQKVYAERIQGIFGTRAKDSQTALEMVVKKAKVCAKLKSRGFRGSVIAKLIFKDSFPQFLLFPQSVGGC